MLLLLCVLQGWTTCSSDTLIRPESTDELAAAIKHFRAKAAAQGRPLKMRATRPSFGTMSSMACASQPSNPSPFLVRGQQPLVVGIMLDKMTKVLAVDHEKKQLRVQAQMRLKELYEAADANQMSTPRSALPWWQGLTLAGVFSTSSHGTGLNTTSMIVSVWVMLSWAGLSPQNVFAIAAAKTIKIQRQLTLTLLLMVLRDPHAGQAVRWRY